MSERASKLGFDPEEDAIADGPTRTREEELAASRAAEARREADRAAAAILAEVAAAPRAEGLRGPAWAWYAAGFVALGFGVVALQLMKPPDPGVEPELLAAVPPPPAHPARAPSPAPAELDLSASIWRGALELRAARLPSDVFTAVVLIDGSRQQWLAQRGDRQDPSCQPSCDGKLPLRVELRRLAPGPFTVVALTSPKAIPPIPMIQWLPHAGEQPPLALGARAYGVRRVERQ